MHSVFICEVATIDGSCDDVFCRQPLVQIKQGIDEAHKIRLHAFFLHPDLQQLVHSVLMKRPGHISRPYGVVAQPEEPEEAVVEVHVYLSKQVKAFP